MTQVSSVRSWCIALLVAGLLAPRQDSSADEPFDYFQNNWNVIGLKDYLGGTRVTPDNRLLLGDKSVVQFRIGKRATLLNRRHAKTALHGWMPIIRVSAPEGSVQYDFTFWATPLPAVKDWRKAFDWPTEGENFLNWIVVKATNAGQTAAEAQVRIEVAGQSRSRKEEHTWSLPPGGNEQCVMRIAFTPVDDPKTFDNEDAQTWLARTEDYWYGVLDGAARIEVPSRKATDALLAAHVCQLIANDHGELHGGEGFYDNFYIRDGAYQVMELEEAGLNGPARKAIDVYLKHQRPDGRFESQKGQLDANGQACWALWQYATITGDRQFLARAYPQMLRSVQWTMKARRQAPEDSAFAGLLPAAPADGEYLWDGKHHILGYDFWNLRGMLCTADAARVLGKMDDNRQLLEEAKEYRAAIDSAHRRLGLAHFPPSWEKQGTHWGNTETLWPTEIFPRDDPRVAALIRHVRKDFGGGFVEGTIQWRGHRPAIHPYMSAYTTMTDLVRGRHEQVVEDFYWYLLHSTAAHAFPEGIFPERRFAWSNTIPHVTGASNYALMLRHMLVHEAGNELHLLSAVPDWWLDDGQVIRIARLPTHFGPLSMTIEGRHDGVRVEWKPPVRTQPDRVLLHLPEGRSLLKAIAGVDVVERSRQAQRWDFAAVVKKYLASRDSISLTTDKPASCSFALDGHAAELANDGRSHSTDAYWATDVTKHPDAWWKVDLQMPATVGRVVVVGYYGDDRHYGFTVETSLDGKSWDLVADRRDNKDLSTVRGYSCQFTPRPVRYIRVTQTHNSANTGRHLVEVMAYER